MSDAHFKVVIIGAGPAGYTAAIYTARADLEPVMFEGMQPGGQLMTTTDVENFPGFPKGVTGPELMMQMREQAERFGTRMVPAMIDKVDFSARPFKLWAEDGTEMTADTVVISTGATARYLGARHEEKYHGKGVSACATCDGAFFRDLNIMVVGGGDSAMEEAMFLTKFAKKVSIVHRRDELRASKIMQKRALDNPKIEVLWNSTIDEYRGEDMLSSVIIKDTVTGETREVPTEGVFMGIGHTPNTAIFKDQIDLDSAGYIITKPDVTETSVPGVFACGDVQDNKYRQAITAAGSGCQAALDVEHYLASLEDA
jgi:thioredoxin reductase (NADPH)